MDGTGGKKWIRQIPLMLALIATGATTLAQQVEKITPGGTRFLIYTPPAYSPSGGPYPLLLVLHGQGGLGDNTNLLINKDDIPSRQIADGRWSSHYPFIVVTPQLKRDLSVPDAADQKWPPGMVDEVVELVRSGYAVDDNRIYITGLSQGAHGSFDYTVAFPGKIAAAVFISGVPDSTVACSVKDVPIWTFHGTDDGLVPPVFAGALIRALNACSPKGKFRPHLNMLYGRRHEGWDAIYNLSSGYNIYDWMLKFSKNNAANTRPYASAGADYTIVDRDHYLHIYGDAFDSDGTISSLQWVKVSGPAVTMQETHSRFLRLSSFEPGTYEFEFRATDDDGAQTADRVRINIIASPGSLAVTGLTLIDGNDQQDIAALSEGYVVNPNILFRNQINIRANVSGSAGSVRFSVNGNQNVRTTNTAPYVLANPRWTAEGGEYLVCATPYSLADGNGMAGVSQCFKMVISATATPLPPPPVKPPPEEPEEPEVPAPTHFYSRPGTDISALSAWSSNADGTGTAPTSFTAGGQTFDVQGAVVLNNALAIGGNGSVFRIRIGGELALNNQVNVPIHMEARSVLHVNTSHTFTSGTIEATAIVNVNAGATTIPAGRYGHLFINGDGTSKTLAAGTTTVAGNLTVSAGAKLEGSNSGASALAIHGNASFLTTGEFRPMNPFTVIFQKNGTQQLTLSATHTLFSGFVVSTGTSLDVSGAPEGTLEVGTNASGSLTVENNGKLTLQKKQLLLTGNAAINPGNQTGQIGFRQSSLAITSSADTHSNLYTITGADSVRNLDASPGQNGTLSLRSVLYVSDQVGVATGSLQSNGFLTLVSTPARTARVVTPPGRGAIAGKVIFQRFIPKGKQTRYLSLPVAGVTVGEVQPYIPVTGTFAGASTGAGLSNDPSLFYYDGTSSNWIAFPKDHNGETFIVGRGYSFDIADNTRNIKLVVAGPLQQGDFTFSLTSNPGNDPAHGWNLIGNPYASPIEWNTAGWTRQQTGPAAYILDDRYPGGRFLVWDGEVGDTEFSGIISQAQGFFVRTTGSSPVHNVTTEAMTDTSSNLWREEQEQAILNFLQVTLKQNDLIDRAFVKFSDRGVDTFDETDAVKKENGYFNLSTLSSDSVALAINHVGESFCDRSFALQISSTSGNYVLMFDGPRLAGETVVNLVDRFVDRIVPVRSGTSYAFQVTSDPASAGDQRFQIQMPSGSMEDPVITTTGNVLTSNAASGNQWLLNGEEIAGATNQSLTAETSGEYSVRVSANGCSRLSSPVSVTVTVTAVNESADDMLRFYPNPAAQWIRVELQAPASGQVTYTIVNALGQRITQGTCNPALLTEGQDIDVSGLVSGVYYLHLRTPKTVYHRKFIIERPRP